MSEYLKLLEIESNKLTIEDVEAVVEMLERTEPQTPAEAAALAKLRWHISAADNEMSVEQRRKDAAAAAAHNEGDE